MAKTIDIKAKVYQNWTHAHIELPIRWEYLTKERSTDLRRPPGWYLHVRTDFGYRWLNTKELKGELPPTPPIPIPHTEATPVEPVVPKEVIVVEQKNDPEPEPVIQPKKVKKDWRTAFLDALD